MSNAVVTVQPLPGVVTDRPEVVGEAIAKAISMVTAVVGMKLVTELAKRTPVDTGLASASWIASIGAPTKATGGTKTHVDRSLQEDSIDRLKLYHIRYGQIFVTNNQPYIMILNTGTSTQAPAGFIEATIESVILDNDLVTAVL